jgi:hypothetical protein
VRSDAFERFLRALNRTDLDRWQGEDFEGAFRSLDSEERCEAESLLIDRLESDTVFKRDIRFFRASKPGALDETTWPARPHTSAMGSGRTTSLAMCCSSTSSPFANRNS